VPAAADRAAADRAEADRAGAADRSFGGRLVKTTGDGVLLEFPHEGGCCLAPLAHDFCRARLVLAHQARLADDIGGEDRG
jgi:hypothetical protein